MKMFYIYIIILIIFSIILVYNFYSLGLENYFIYNDYLGEEGGDL